jgi:hypothetical protein
MLTDAAGFKWYTTDVSNGTGVYGEGLGKFYLALPATTGTNDIRVQLFVKYDVEFTQRIPANMVTIAYTGGEVIGGTSLTPSNILGIGSQVDAQARGFTVDASGVITFLSPGHWELVLRYNGTGNTGLPSIPGWTLNGFVAGPTDCMAQYFANIGGQNTVGPIAAPATTITSSYVTLAQIPFSSFTADDPRKPKQHTCRKCDRPDCVRLSAPCSKKTDEFTMLPKAS